MLKFRMSESQHPNKLPDQRSCANLNQGICKDHPHERGKGDVKLLFYLIWSYFN